MMMAAAQFNPLLWGVFLFFAAGWTAGVSAIVMDCYGCIRKASCLVRHWQRHLVYLSPFASLAIWAFFVLLEGLKNPIALTPRFLFCYCLGTFGLICVSSDPMTGGIREVADRRNYFAGWVIIGANLGLVLCLGLTFVITPDKIWGMEDFAPDTDGIVAVFLGIGGMVVFLVLWTIFERWTSIREAITIEREGGAALRLATLLVALGVLLGDAFGRTPVIFQSGEHLLSLAAPVVLFVFALRVERLCKAAPGPPCSGPQRRDFVIAASFLILAGGFLLVAG
jgi:hypothetical protein